MDNDLRTLLHEYLDSLKIIDDVREWVAVNIWDAPAESENIVDQLAIELSHLDDGTADELYFRSQIQTILGVVVRLELNEWTPRGQNEAVATNQIHPGIAVDPLIPPKPVRWVHSFA